MPWHGRQKRHPNKSPPTRRKRKSPHGRTMGESEEVVTVRNLLRKLLESGTVDRVVILHKYMNDPHMNINTVVIKTPDITRAMDEYKEVMESNLVFFRVLDSGRELELSAITPLREKAMGEVQERDLISRSEVYKLFEKDGTAKLHVAQIDQLPAVDVMKLTTVQRLENELAETKMSLAIARLGEIAKKSAPKIRLIQKVKPLNVKALTKGHADGIRTNIHIVDEWADAGPKPTPPREIIPDLKQGDMVAFASEEGRKAYGTKIFLVESIWEPFAMIVDAPREKHMLIEKRHLKLIKEGGKER